MNTMQDWFDAYAVSHQNPTNKTFHWVCVPLIFFSLVALLSEIPMGDFPLLFPSALISYIHMGTFVILVGLLFYIRLSFSMFLGMLVVSGAILYLNANLKSMITSMPYWAFNLGLFILAWIGQFIGHKIEGQKPSFIDDVKFLLIGPGWLLSFIYTKVGLKY